MSIHSVFPILRELGAYTEKFFPGAPRIRDMHSIFAILKRLGGIYRKILPLCPTYHKKRDLA